MFEQFPYVNFHELNLDWIIQKIKECYSPDNPPDNFVLSVNGQTGDVILYQNAEVTLPAVDGQAWEIKRYVAGNHTAGIAFQKNDPAMRLDGNQWYDIYDEGNPPPYPVTSVNGQTGDITINVPVQSVNGQTGNVVINVPVQSVNGQTGAVTVPVAFQNNTVAYLKCTNAANVDQWGLEREVPSGSAGISFEIENGHVVGYLNFTDSNDQVIDTLKILTPDDIPSSSGVVSVNGASGVVVLTANDIAMSGSDTTKVKAKIESLETAVTGNTANINYIRDDIAPTWSGSTSYMKGKVVYNGGSLYIATADNPAGTFASQSWQLISLCDETENKAAESTLAYLENTNTATHNIPSGAYVYWKTGLYKASAAISIGDTLSSSNLTGADAGGALNVLSDQIGNYIKSYNVTIDNTGSLAAGATKTVTKLISSFIDSGYSVIAVIPRYSGDDQFCFTNVSYNTTEISATVRNVSSSADSGAPSVFVLAVKT